ncbi:putative uncharacterized protein DDB_G0282133 [Nymphalis io]|uniref:putative uncharacterized protein DDB_G0282133 n=1 Tax=Inachis io TaxID=171585 RepID=UPI0021695734|nr:putative uncharacterized protein DDB_G0282133 [Nymphalis io]
MKTVMQTIWLLVTILIINKVCCQDGYSDQDFYRLQQYSNNNAQTEAVTGYNTNIMQREPHSQSMTSAGVQYLSDENNNGDYSRGDRSKGRKVYRIKNPFQQQQEEDKPSQDTDTQDSETGASNQYTGMQYSLPPEDFLQRMRAESQYHNQQQLSTPVSASPYTATPQPQYQYSTIQPSNYDINQQSNQISSLEPKAYTPVYQPNINSFQYSNQNLYNLDNAHSTPIPPYMSTPLPNTQYLGTPVNTYVSSSSPIYLSSPQNVQQYVSSPNTNTQSGVLDYNNNRVTTIGSNYETNNDVNKRRQIDHYDNSNNGVRYPTNIQNQYQNDYTPSTTSPTLSTYPDSWQNSLSTGYNVLSKSENDYLQTQYQNLRYNNNQKDKQETNADVSNGDTHRIGSMQSANNVFLNYIQPDYQFYSNVKSQSRDSEPETSQSEVYSHGDYGWKLSDKKSSYEPEISSKNNYFKYQIHSVQPDSGAVSQVSFQMDSSKPYNYETNTKPIEEKKLEAEEFARAAVKAHEKYKQQLEAGKYLSNSQYNNNVVSNSFGVDSYYNNDNMKQNNKLYNYNAYGNSQSEAVTSSPFYYINSRDNLDSRTKQPFDHDKALKNIVSIDMSNVVQNSDSSVKTDTDTSNRFNFYGHNKDAEEQNFKQYSRLADSFYGDKNSLYAIKSKPDDYISLDKLKQSEYGKHQLAESFYNLGSGNKRLIDEMTQTLAKQISNNQQNNVQSSASINQQGLQHSQISSDIANILKFNDIPYRLTQSLNSNSQYLRNNNFDQGNNPSPLPARINQNVENHHIDVTAEILNKLMANNKPANLKMNRPDTDLQSGNLISTINGYKVANPFNVDLKLVADMLKGKAAVDESQMTSFNNKPLPIKLDVSQLQQLLQFKNENNAMALNNGLSSITNSFFDIYNSGRSPYQGVKYSRSEEEPENIPLADSSNNHPIGAVIEQEGVVAGEIIADGSESAEDDISSNLDDDRPNNVVISSGQRGLGDRHRQMSTYSSRHSYKRKYPKSEFEEPYPLLKPPPPHSSRHRQGEKSRRRRVNKPKMLRVFKTEPLYEAGTFIDDDIKPIHMKHVHVIAEDKSDTVNEEETM